MKHLHPSNFTDGPPPERSLAVQWPALPWTCPICDVTYDVHMYTIATVPNPETPENHARATFKCVGCDIVTFNAN